jgi:hypothetical protein
MRSVISPAPRPRRSLSDALRVLLALALLPLAGVPAAAAQPVDDAVWRGWVAVDQEVTQPGAFGGSTGYYRNWTVDTSLTSGDGEWGASTYRLDVSQSLCPEGSGREAAGAGSGVTLGGPTSGVYYTTGSGLDGSLPSGTPTIRFAYTFRGRDDTGVVFPGTSYSFGCPGTVPSTRETSFEVAPGLMGFAGPGDYTDPPMRVVHAHSWSEVGNAGVTYSAVVCMSRSTVDTDLDGLPDDVDLDPLHAGTAVGLGHPAGSSAWDQPIPSEWGGPQGVRGLPTCPSGTDGPPPADPGRIVFVRDGDIHAIRPDGSDLTQLTTTGDTASPAWSPDGSRIAFTRGEGADLGVHVMYADGTEPIRLAAGSEPAWSPDATRIAFVGDDGDGIFVMDAGGSDVDRLTGPGEPDASPAWSPDGGRIAFTRWLNDPAVYSVAADGSDLQELNDYGFDPAWSPDGGTIAFGRFIRLCQGALWLMDRGGGDPRELVREERDCETSSPSFSLTGDQIVFSAFPLSEDDPRFPGGDALPAGLHVVDVDGSDRGFLTEGHDPHWQPTAPTVTDLPPTDATLALEVDRATVPAGAVAVPIRAIPLDLAPLRSLGVEGAPLRSLDVAASPLRSLPLRSLPLRSLPLRSLTLSSVAVDGGWEPLLAGTDLQGLPLQTLTLADVDELDPSPLDQLTLGQLNFDSTPLRSLSLASIVLGSTPLRSLPLPDGGSWCEVLAGLGFSCAELGIDGSSTILDLDIAGVSLASTPLRSLPLRSLDLAATPLRSLPLRSLDLAATPLRSLPLRSLDIAAMPLRSLPLRSLAALDTIVDCDAVDCETATLGDAYEAGAIRESAVLGELGEYGDTVLGDLEPWFPEQLTLGDILIALVTRAGFPWEQLPLDEMGVQDFAGTGEHVRYTAAFTLGDGGEGGRAGDTTVTVTLPAGFRYAGGAELVSSDAGGELGRQAVSPTIAGRSLTFDLGRLDAVDGLHRRLSFDASPALRLGSYTAAATLDASGVEAGAISPAVEVTEHYEPDNDQPATAPIADRDVLYLGHIARPGDVDLFRIPAPPKGSRIRIHLSHLSSDQDLVLYSPVASTPLRSLPLRSLPLRSLPISDDRVDLHSELQPLPPEGLQDIPLRSLPLRSLSNNRGSADEIIETQAREGTGHYVVQVSGYNGATSPDPYVLRVQVTAPVGRPACAVALPPAVGEAGSVPELPDEVDTLFLVNEQRLRGAHGTEAAARVLASTRELAGRHDLGVVGAVVPVDGDAEVRAAWADWEADACEPERANEVVTAITSLTDTLRDAHPRVRNIVLVGADDVLPMARIPDLTTLSNERDYAPELGGADPLSAAFATEHVLTDDPYGDTAPIGWLDRALYVPDLAVGRLVESPEDILAQLALFVDSRGVLDPSTALTTGYDFLTDGAEAIDTALAGGIDQRTRLVDDDWTREDLITNLFPRDGSTPDLASVNAHFDHRRALPALPDRLGRYGEDDLFTVDDVPAGRLDRRVLFSMGCHSALSVPDGYVPRSAALGQDWPQVFSGERAIYVGNTGFGYGDTDTVGLSERLMELFAEHLHATANAGDALRLAKHAYQGEMGIYGVYDEKVLMQTVLYGLPMFRIGGADLGPPPPDAPAPVEDPATGLPSSVVTVEPDLARTEVPRGSFWSVQGETQVTHHRPIQPRTSVDVTRSELVARGAVVTGLRSRDVTGVDPVFARPTVDHSVREPEHTFGDVAFPAFPLNLTAYEGPHGLRQRLVVMPGQFLSGETPGAGTQRLYDRVDTLVYYGDPDAEYVQPEFRQVEAVADGEQVRFEADVIDRAARDEDEPTGQVVRVLVVYRDGAGAWRSVDLAPNTNGRWAATVTASAEVTFFAQAVDAVGNVGVTTNKGRSFDARPGDTGPGEPTIGLSGPAGTGGSGWFVGPVTVRVTGVTDATVRIDGGEPRTPPVVITDDGVHLVEVTAGETTVTEIVRIDTAPPTATSGAPASFAVGAVVDAPFACADEGSGVAACDALDPVRLDTSTAGTHEHIFRVETVDVAGNDAIHTLSYVYEVQGVTAPRDDGFLAPTRRPPEVNVVQPGRVVPLRFAVGEETDGGAVEAISVTSYPCDGSGPAGPATVLPLDGLRYDGSGTTASYQWRTDRAWSGSCRRVEVRLRDGGVLEARFRFR